MAKAPETLPDTSKAIVTPARARLQGWTTSTTLVWPIAALILVLLFNLAFTPGFLHIEVRDGALYGSLIDVLSRGSRVMILALGMTLVISTGGVDLSVGAVMAIAGAVAACLVQRPKFSPLSAINVHGSVAGALAVALAFALAAGTFNGLLVAAAEIQPIVATLILMVAGRGIAQLLAGGQIVTFQNRSLAYLSEGHLLGLPFPAVLALAAFGITVLLTRRTALGLFIESVGNNPAASRLAGVNARGVKLAVYAFSGLCAGMAGLIEMAGIKGADANNAGLNYELDAILAVCVGGTSLSGGRFSLVGSMVGALLIQALTTTILTRGVSAHVTLVVKAAVVIAVCLLQSPQFRAALSRKRRAAA